jgi:hypothetical protein
MSRLPLKFKTNFDFQEMSDSDHNYLAYIAGLELETASGTYSESTLGSLGKTNQTNDLNIGSFTNTVLVGDVGDQGTEGVGDLAFTTTQTPIYQQDGSVSLHADFRKPLYQKRTNGQQEIQEFSDADELSLGETLAGIIYANDYPGTFKLGSTTPTPTNDYAIAVANVMTDTRADNTSTVYNLYQRKTYTITEDEIDLMAVARGSSSPYNANAGTYRGLIIMGDSHRSKTAKGCLDRHLATISPTNLPIGSYLIRSATGSTVTPPTQTGTWVEKGTATDTRNIIEEETVDNTVTTNYSLSSSNHWQRVSTTTPAFGDGVEVYIGGSLVASSTNPDATTITVSGSTYTRSGSGEQQSVTGPQGNRTVTRWYDFTTTTGGSTTADVIKSSVNQNVITHKLYVRTA